VVGRDGRAFGGIASSAEPAERGQRRGRRRRKETLLRQLMASQKEEKWVGRVAELFEVRPYGEKSRRRSWPNSLTPAGAMVT